MSTRSANNKRNQEKLQGASGSGMARKSTSSAKPARPAGGSVRVVPATAKAKRAAAERGEDLSNLSKEEKKARKAELRREEDRIYTASSQLMKEDEDYLRYRRIWWVLLVIGILALIGTWVLLAVLGQDGMADQGRPDRAVCPARGRLRCDHRRLYLRLHQDSPDPQRLPR